MKVGNKRTHNNIENILSPLFELSEKINPFHKNLHTKHDYDPFLIIGSGRSGNTLLRSMLATHSKIAIPPESYVLPKVIAKYYLLNFLPWKKLVKTVIVEFEKHKEFYTWDTDLSSIKEDLLSVPKKDRSLAKIVSAIYRQYIKKHFPSSKLWGDKTPLNTLYLSWINKLFPNAKYIHLIRDGRAVVNSYVKQGIYDNHGEACARWNTSIEKARKFKDKYGRDKVFEVRYEDLVVNPKKELEKICKFLDINFEQEMLEYYKISGKLGDTKLYSHHKNVGKPLDRKLAKKWKQELSKTQRNEIEKNIGKNLKLLGYL